MAKFNTIDQLVRVLGMQFDLTLKDRVIAELRLRTGPIIEKIAVEICKDIRSDLDSQRNMLRMRDEICIRLQLNDREIDLATLLLDSPPDAGDDN